MKIREQEHGRAREHRLHSEAAGRALQYRPETFPRGDVNDRLGAMEHALEVQRAELDALLRKVDQMAKEGKVA